MDSFRLLVASGDDPSSPDFNFSIRTSFIFEYLRVRYCLLTLQQGNYLPYTHLLQSPYLVIMCLCPFHGFRSFHCLVKRPRFIREYSDCSVFGVNSRHPINPEFGSTLVIIEWVVENR